MRIFIYLIIFFAFFDLFAQLPVMSPFAEALGATPFLTGLTVGLYSFANTGGNVISGILADRRGPFAVLTTGLCAAGAALFLYRFAEDPYSLLAVRAIHGLAAGLIIPAAFTYSANRTSTEKRGRGGALAGAFIGMAAIAGPAFSSVFAARTSVPAAMSVTGALLLATGAAAFFLLNRKEPAKIRRTEKQELQDKTPAKKQAAGHGLLRSYTGAFFLMFSQGVLAYMLPLKAIRLGFGTETGGLLFSVFGLAAIAVFLLPVNRLFDRILPVHTMTGGLAVMAGALFFLNSAESLPALYAAMIAYGAGFAFLFPSINSLLIDSTDPLARGKAYGFFYAFFSAGVVAGSGIAGALSLTADASFAVSGTLLLLLALANVLIRPA